VCFVNVFSKKLTASPCEGQAVILAYSETSGATAIECSEFINETRIVIYDRLNPRAGTYLMENGKLIRPEALSRSMRDELEDAFASRPLCSAHISEPLPGDLILISKEFSNSEDHPYCYRVNFIHIEDTISVRSDTGHEFKPISEKMARQWMPIRKKLSALLKRIVREPEDQQ
jgi:hypothetical protein